MVVKETIEVRIPLINPNEPEALLADLSVSEGQEVNAGDLICTLETTKSSVELEAETSGYIICLNFVAGDTVNAGDILCYLADDPEWHPPHSDETPGASMDNNAIGQGLDEEVPTELRITKPAIQLAREHNLDLNSLHLNHLITKSDIQEYIDKHQQKDTFPEIKGPLDPNSIIVYGGGGHGKALIDMLLVLDNHQIIGVLDDNMPKGSKILNFPVLGGSEQLMPLFEQGLRFAINAVGGIGSPAVREKVFKKLTDAGLVCPPVIHPRAFVEASASLVDGVQVFPHAYVGSEAHLGFGCIINTGAIVSHECQLGDYTNISPGAMLAGEVQIGARALIGMGVTVNLCVRIGEGARVGNGATVKEDVPANSIVRAGSIWPDI